MSKIIIGIIVVAGGIAGMLFLFSNTNESKERVLSEEGRQILPDVILQDTKGKDVRIREFLATPLVIYSWTAWCPFCKEELADFAEVQKEFGGKIKIIAIDRKETLEKTKEFTDSIEVTNELLFLLDPSDLFYRAINGFSMPETIFVDENGIIKDHARGVIRAEEMRRRIKRAFHF